MASNSGPRASRPSSAASGQRSSSLGLNTNLPPYSPVSTTKEPPVAPEKAKSYLIDHNYIKKDENISTRTLLKVLLTLAETKAIDANTLKHRIHVVVNCFNHHMAELLVESSTQFLGERLESLRKEAKDKAEEETSIVRKSVEEQKNKLEAEKMKLDEDRKAWMDTRGALETCEGRIKSYGEATERKIDALSDKLNGISQKIEDHIKTSSQMRPPWAESDNTAYNSHFPPSGAGVGASGPGPFASTPSYFRPPPSPSKNLPSQEQILDPEFNRIRNTEEKRDRQLLLEKLEINGERKSLGSMTSSEVIDEVNRVLDEIKSQVSPRQQRGMPAYIKCIKAEQQTKGGVLLSLNIPETRNWVTRTDICAEFLSRLSFAAKIVPRRYKVVVQNLNVNTNLDDEDLCDRVVCENELEPGDIQGISWIRKHKNDNQRVAFAVVDCRTKEAANLFLGGRATIETSSVNAVKYMSDALRCFNCQLDTAPQLALTQ